MKKILNWVVVTCVVTGLCSCEQAGREEVPYTKVTGEFVTDLTLTGAAEAHAVEHVEIFNTAEGTDSLWIVDHDFFQSQVKVKWDGKRSFSAVEGVDIVFGEVVNITGEIQEDGTINIEWRYLQGGDPADDYVVVGVGHRYTGLDGDF
jgi:hypothetical protein